MIFPLLVFLAAGIFLIARAGVGKEAAATHARNKSWEARASAQPGEIYRLTHDPADSRVSGGHSVRVLPGPLFRDSSFNAESAGFAIDRTWDHRDVPFDQVGDFKLHERPYRLLAGNIPGGETVVPVTAAMAFALNPSGNPLLAAAAAVGAAGNVLVRVAGVVLKALGIVFVPIKAVVEVLRLAARLSFKSGLARRLGRVLDLLDLAGRSFDNLDRASQGLPVENPSGLGSLRVP